MNENYDESGISMDGFTQARALNRMIGSVVFLISLAFSGTGYAKDVTRINDASIKQNGFEAKIQPAPSWVEPIQLSDTLHSAKAGNINYHLYDQQGYAGDKPQRYFRIVKEANNISGLESASQLQISFSPLYQNLYLHGATVYRRGEAVYTLSKKDVKLFSNEDELDKQLLSGRASALILLPSTQVGDIIDFEYSIEGTNPVFGNRFSIEFDLGWSVPVDIAQARVVIPNGKDIQYKTMATNIEPRVDSNGFGKIYTWQLVNPAPIYDEEQYPYGFDRYPYVSVSEYKSWQEVVDQQLPFYRNRTLPSSLKKQLATLTKGLTQEQTVAKALQFVQQQIRYLGLEYGVNAYKPHLPSDVWKNRRGDCKDKTLLLIAILEHLGIEAFPALVNTGYREGLRNVIPSSTRFDHVITFVELNGVPYFLDPTKLPQYGSLNQLGYHSFDQALILKKGQIELTQMPQDQMDNHRTEVIEEITISDYTAPVRFKVTSKYFGRSAEKMKAKFDEDHVQRIQMEYQQYYEKSFGEVISTKPLIVNFNEVENRFEVTEEYVINKFFEFKDNKVRFSVSALAIKDQLHIPRVQNRESPFYLGRPKTVSHQVKIHFPKEELSTSADVTRIIENQNFRFKYDDIALPSTYILNFEYQIKNWVVEQKHARTVIEQMNEVSNIAYQTFNFEPDSAFVDHLVGDLMRNETQSSSGVANGGLEER